MIEEKARVIEVSGDNVWVETQRKTVCGHCEAQKGCGTGALSKIFRIRSPRIQVKASNSVVKAGDEIMIGIDEFAFLRGAFSVYMLPLLFMVITAWLAGKTAQWLGYAQADAFSIAGGVIGLALAFYWLSKRAVRTHADHRYHPVILRIIKGQDD